VRKAPACGCRTSDASHVLAEVLEVHVVHVGVQGELSKELVSEGGRHRDDASEIDRHVLPVLYGALDFGA
jgi:hypothetical protein